MTGYVMDTGTMVIFAGCVLLIVLPLAAMVRHGQVLRQAFTHASSHQPSSPRSFDPDADLAGRSRLPETYHIETAPSYRPPVSQQQN